MPSGNSSLPTYARKERGHIWGTEASFPSEEKIHKPICGPPARQEWPDNQDYDAPEVAYRMKKFHHAGLIVRSPEAARVTELLEEYGERFLEDFGASMPIPDRPTA